MVEAQISLDTKCTRTCVSLLGGCGQAELLPKPSASWRSEPARGALAIQRPGGPATPHISSSRAPAAACPRPPEEAGPRPPAGRATPRRERPRARPLPKEGEPALPSPPLQQPPGRGPPAASAREAGRPPGIRAPAPGGGRRGLLPGSACHPAAGRAGYAAHELPPGPCGGTYTMIDAMATGHLRRITRLS